MKGNTYNYRFKNQAKQTAQAKAQVLEERDSVMVSYLQDYTCKGIMWLLLLQS